jgi:hypothetical protein
MRKQGTHALYAWIAVLVLTALLAVLANGSMALPAIPVATATPSSEAATTVAPAQAGPLLSDARGFIAVPDKTAPAILRRETDGDPIVSLRGQGFLGAVSGTRRRVAYWTSGSSATDGGARELRVFDVTAADQDTRLATLPEAERGALVVWSSDRSGVLVVVESSGKPDSTGAPGPFSALRVVDVPTRSIREIARVIDGSQLWPVGWDRVARVAGACVYRSDGMAIAWSVVGEDTLSARVPMDEGIPAKTVRGNGTDVLGVQNESVIRVWTIASYDAHTELGAEPGERIAFARWKPGADEIVVLVADRLEIWPAKGGDRRVVARGVSAASDLLVSSDGALAFVTHDGGRSAMAVDLATGVLAPLPMSGAELAAPISFR